MYEIEMTHHSLAKIRRATFAVAACVLLTMAGTSPTSAKDGTEARLDAPVPRSAQPGDVVRIGWVLGSEVDGTWHSFSACDVQLFVFSAIDPVPMEVPAVGCGGHYVVEFTVPNGGIDRVEIGLGGMRFPITYTGAIIDPLPGNLRAGHAVEAGVTLLTGGNQAPWPKSVVLVLAEYQSNEATNITTSPTSVSGRYVGTLSVPKAGRFSLKVAIGDGSSAFYPFEPSRVWIDVQSAVKSTPPDSSLSAESGLAVGVPSLLLAMLAAIGAFGLIVVRQRNR
ncbi:MAG TPA: hypothetical protein VGQ58_08625 [Candidatus Limnocylindrales bacterium]|nr:hypothetical protein [Candidatus Limnocylindrales bacterium]